MHSHAQRLLYRYLLAFGSNLGDRWENLRVGLSQLSQWAQILRQSSWKETLPLKNAVYNTEGQGAYLNFVCEVESPLEPGLFYSKLQIIEDAIGHDRQQKWNSREIDIDILFAAIHCEGSFNNGQPVKVYVEGGLRIPHCEFWNRDFLVQMVVGELSIPEEVLRRHENA